MSSPSNGIFNLEWAVRPPSKGNEAIPKEATTKTILPSDLTLDIIVCQRNVVSVQPCL